MRTLNYRQRLFALHLLNSAKGDPAKAARLAGYKNPSVGYSLVKHHLVAGLIEAKIETAAMQSEEVLARITDIASADHDDLITLDESGRPTFDYEKLKKAGKTHLIKKMEILPGGGVRVELHDAHAALNTLAKISGLMRERVDIHQITDGSESTERIIAILGGFTELSRETGTPKASITDQSSPLCNSGECGEVGASPTLEISEQQTPASGEREKQPFDDLYAAETRQEFFGQPVLPGLVSGETPTQESDTYVI